MAETTQEILVMLGLTQTIRQSLPILTGCQIVRNLVKFWPLGHSSSKMKQCSWHLTQTREHRRVMTDVCSTPKIWYSSVSISEKLGRLCRSPFTRWSITQPQIVQFRSRFVQSLNTWQPIDNKRSRSNVKGQGHRVKRRLIAKLLLCFRKSGSLNLMVMSECWSATGS